jgi:hypothetical protein
MKIVVYPRAGRSEPWPHQRKTRRLVYMAWLARDLGYDVAFHVPSGRLGHTCGAEYDWLDIVKGIPLVRSCDGLTEDYTCADRCTPSTPSEESWAMPR